MRRTGLCVFVVFSTCAAMVGPCEPAKEEVVGGISDARPYFGRYTESAPPLDELGDFLLASCGCGEWRVLITPDGTLERSQMVVRFYSQGPYEPTGEVTFEGQEGDSAVSGSLDQALGEAEGDLTTAGDRMLFWATRTEAHTADADTCLLCHVGEDPIWPLPETHPAFEVDPPSCLECHSIE